MSGLVHDEDSDLEFTQGLRRKLINKVTKDGTDIPTDTESANVLLGALNDMDRQALGRKRLKVDQDLGDAAKQGAAIIAHVFHTMAGKPDPFATKDVTPGRLPAHPEKLVDELVLVPGELDQTAHETTYAEIMGGAEKPK